MIHKEDVYRMGGDEFMVCGINKIEMEIKDAIDLFRREIKKAGYSVAIGLEYQHQNPCEMITMMKQAEKKMLENKRRFYEQSGFDRRKKHSAPET